MKSEKGKGKKVKIRIGFKFYILLFTLLTLPGCWDFHEVDKLSYITTVGVDQMPNRMLNLTIQVPILQTGLPPVITGGQEVKKFYTVNQTAETVTDALDLLETKTVGSLVLNQTKSVIIGEEAAHRNVKPILDHFIRTNRMPLPAYIFVTDGVTAEEVLTLEPVQNRLPGTLFITTGQSATTFDMTNFISHWEFQQKLVHRSKDTYAPLISIDKIHRLYIISGLAVFNGNRMAGKLSAYEVEIFGLLTRVQKSGLMKFNISGNKLYLSNVKGKSKLKINIDQGNPIFRIETAVHGSITELTSPKITVSPQDIAEFEKIVAREIEKRIIDLVKKLQGYNSDIIDFGEELRVRRQEIWKKTEWKKVFPAVPFSVKVKVHIEGDGRFR